MRCEYFVDGVLQSLEEYLLAEDGTIEIEYAPERTYDNEKIIKETFYNDIDYISGSKNGLKYLDLYSH